MSYGNKNVDRSSKKFSTGKVLELESCINIDKLLIAEWILGAIITKTQVMGQSVHRMAKVSTIEMGQSCDFKRN